jgi:CPA1 family monovalent cation:H+ antiporter
VIRWLGLAKAGHREIRADLAEEFRARERAVAAAMERLDGLIADHSVPDDIAHELRAQHKSRLQRIADRSKEDRKKISALRDQVDLQLMEAERDAINALYRKGALKDEARRRIERDIDLREAHIANIQNEL